MTHTDRRGMFDEIPWWMVILVLALLLLVVLLAFTGVTQGEVTSLLQKAEDLGNTAGTLSKTNST